MTDNNSGAHSTLGLFRRRCSGTEKYWDVGYTCPNFKSWEKCKPFLDMCDVIKGGWEAIFRVTMTCIRMCKCFTASDIPVFTCHSCIHVWSSNSHSFYVILRRFLSRENWHGSGAVICLPFGRRELQHWGQDPHPQTRWGRTQTSRGL